MEIFFTIVKILWWAVQILFAVYLLLPMTLLLLMGWFNKKSTLPNGRKKLFPGKEFDFAAIVTAHKDTKFILPLADSFARQRYNNFMVYIIADDCDISGIEINDPRIRVIKPEIALHSKVKSIHFALEKFERAHEVMVVFDADNLVHPDYFAKLNQYYQAGYEVVQTHMLSKNFDTVYARLDSIGHIFNTFTEREARMRMGLSSCILGLGISLKTKLYDEIRYNDSLGGFDKKLQAFMVKRVGQIAFANDVIVYDEKVADGDTFERQRTRWIYTYFKYFKDNMALLLLGVRKFRFNLIYFGFNALRPPLFLTLGAGLFFFLINIFLSPLVALLWAAVLFLFVLAFILIAITQCYQPGMSGAVLYLPVVVFRQVKAIMGIGKAKKDFLETTHDKVIYISDLVK